MSVVLDKGLGCNLPKGDGRIWIVERAVYTQPFTIWFVYIEVLDMSTSCFNPVL